MNALQKLWRTIARPSALDAPPRHGAPNEAPAKPQTRVLPLTEDDLRTARSVVAEDETRLLQIAAVRQAITLRRLDRIDHGSFRLMPNPSSAIGNTVEHNLRGMRVCMDRPDRLIGILGSLQTVRTDIETKKVLVIGPRSECELFTLVGMGFALENIRGLDLISYNESVDLGDMHATPYEAGAFDVAILSAVWGYSSDPDRLADELCRIVRPGGVIAISQEYNPKTNEELIAESGTPLTAARPRYDDIEQILLPFGERIEAIAFRHDLANVPKSWASDRIVEMLVAFHLKERP